MSLKWEAGPHKHPMARAKGLGAARQGVHHWIVQRLTSIALVPLSLWAMWSVPLLVNQPYYVVEDWVSQPFNAILLLLLITSVFHHTYVGVQVVVEDYVHSEAAKIAIMIGMRLLAAGLSVAGLFSILRVAL